MTSRFNSLVLITGVSPNSLGSQLALCLSAHSPAHLLLASRTTSNLTQVKTGILSLYPTTKISLITLDLSSLPSVHSTALEIQTLLGTQKLTTIFNNAGINVPTHHLTQSGHELQFATNHLGHFLLTNLLLTNLDKGGRVVNTTSEAHRISPIRFSDINQVNTTGQILEEEKPRKNLPKGVLKGDGGYEGSIAYGMSKCAGILFSLGLRERGVTSFAVDPGNVLTSLPRSLTASALKTLMQIPKEQWKNLDQGVAGLLIAALDPTIFSENGLYISDCRFKRPARWASDSAAAERLWVLSEEMVGLRSRGSRL